LAEDDSAVLGEDEVDVMVDCANISPVEADTFIPDSFTGEGNFATDFPFFTGLVLLELVELIEGDDGVEEVFEGVDDDVIDLDFSLYMSNKSFQYLVASL
jgi:hypothetical protein